MNNNIRVNVIINLIRTVALTILSFITFPYVCRVLGDDVFGAYTWANTFVYYFLILAKIGIPNLAIRECVKVRDNKELLSNKAQAFFILQGIATSLSFGLMCIFVFSVPQLFDVKGIIFLLSLNFITGAFSFEWIFIALEKQVYMSIRSILVLTLSAILIIVLVKNPDDVYIYALITAGLTLIISIANVIYLKGKISFLKTMPYNFKQYFKPLLTLFSLSMVLALYNQSDTFILGFLDINKTAVASYSVGIKGIDIIIAIIANLSTVFIPRAAHLYIQEDKSYFRRLLKYSINICLFIVLPAIVTMSTLSNQICTLIAGEQGYDGADIVLISLSFMMLTYSIGDIIYGQILLPAKKEKYYLFSVLIATLLNIGCSLIFGLFIFKDSPHIGVAISTMIIDALLLFALIAMSFDWIKKALFNINTLKLLIANAIICVVSILLVIVFPIENLYAEQLSITNSYMLTLAVIVAIDAIIYLLTLFFLKEDLVMSFFKKKTAN